MEQRFSNKIVEKVIYLNSVFAAAIIIVFLITKHEPTVLVGSWFGSFTLELLVLARISIEKVRTEGREKSEDSGNGIRL